MQKPGCLTSEKPGTTPVRRATIAVRTALPHLPAPHSRLPGPSLRPCHRGWNLTVAQASSPASPSCCGGPVSRPCQLHSGSFLGLRRGASSLPSEQTGLCVAPLCPQMARPGSVASPARPPGGLRLPGRTQEPGNSPSLFAAFTVASGKRGSPAPLPHKAAAT